MQGTKKRESKGIWSLFLLSEGRKGRKGAGKGVWETDKRTDMAVSSNLESRVSKGGVVHPYREEIGMCGRVHQAGTT